MLIAIKKIVLFAIRISEYSHYEIKLKNLKPDSISFTWCILNQINSFKQWHNLFFEVYYLFISKVETIAKQQNKNVNKLK